MKSVCSVKFCLEDIRSCQDADRMFQIIEQGKAAIKAASCKCSGIGYTNELDQIENPRGSIGTLIFDVVSPDDKQREFRTSFFSVKDYDITRVFSHIACCRKDDTSTP